MKTKLFCILCLLSFGMLFPQPSPTAKALSAPAPVITSVTPSSVKNDLDATITIHGDNFEPRPSGQIPEIWLGVHKLDQTTHISATMQTAVIPWGLNPGEYSLKVVNPDGQEAVYPGQFTILPGLGGWSNMPMYGGNIEQIVFSPHDEAVLFARSWETGLYRSSDGGSTWASVLPKNILTQVAFDLLDPGFVLTGGGGGLNRSNDGGIAWEQIEIPPHLWQNITPGDSGPNILYPFISPHTRRILAAGMSFMPGAPPIGGVVCSGDHGDSWVACSTGLDGAQIDVLAFHPTQAGEIIAGSTDGKIFRSQDDGSSWTELADLWDSIYVSVLAYNPYNPDEIWASSSEQMTLRSTGTDYADTENNWVEVKPGGSSASLNLTFSPFNSLEILASGWGGPYISTDGGASWTHYAAFGFQGSQRFTFHPSAQEVVFAAHPMHAVLKTESFHSDQPGWATSHQGLAGLIPDQLAASAAHPDQVYASIPFWPGLFRYQQPLQSWEFLRHVHGFRFALDPHHPGVIFRGWEGEAYQGRVAISADGGQTWEAGPHLQPTSAYTGCGILPVVIRFDPQHPGWAVAGTRNACGGWWFTDEGSFYRTQDGGQTWHVAALSDTVKHIVDLAYDTADPSIIYASTRGSGMLRSLDGGASWHRIAPDRWELADQRTIAVDPNPPYRIYTSGYGISYSDDHGETWQRPEDPFAIATFKLVFAGGPVSSLYAATDEGLMVSTDGAATWTPVEGPLARVSISTLEIVQTGQRTILYAGTAGGIVPAEPVSAAAAARSETLITPGVYRYTLYARAEPKLYLPLVRR